ncbi:MAG TPA: SIMPL domain-containing protein [Kofleriaceae bacterium]|nr:SIMPL domain-containing protein [Kofleriaceae bacterium]
MTLPRLFIHTSILLALAVALAIAATRPTPTQHITVALPAAETAHPPGAQPRGFTVSGTATLEAVPDIADLRATISVEHPSAREATRVARQRQEAARAALDRAGVPAADLALGHLQLTPVHHPKTGALLRYQASIALTASTRDFDRLAPLMEALGAAGATHMATTFRVADLPALKKKVRQMAGKAAREKAAELASAVGFELGEVRAVVEAPGDGWAWNGVYANAIATEAAPQAPHGDLQSVTLSVTVTYDLKKG